jgi:hypothetical protein
VHSLSRPRLLVIVPALLVLAIGCGQSEPKLFPVSGTVSYDGSPIPAGLIYFDPDVTKGGSGQQGFAKINQGKFDSTVEGLGIKGGPYVVRVLGFDGKPADEAPFGAALFPEYTESRDLPKSKSEVTIDVPKKKKK